MASEIADKLCASVVTKLEGKTIGTFGGKMKMQYMYIHTCTLCVYCVLGVQSVIRASMEESLVQILSPKRRIDLLQDAMEAKKSGKPYVVTFCGVNGVGKSTNLAKVQKTEKDGGVSCLLTCTYIGKYTTYCIHIYYSVS